MNLAFSEEQDELRRSLRKFCDTKSPSSEVLRLMETPDGFDEAVWKQMAQELGLQGLHIPEGYGGQGFSFVELGIVMEEMGRALLCAPFFSTVCLAANAILNGGTDAQRRALLPRIANGELTATLALAEPNGRWDAEGIETIATDDGGAWILNGTKSFAIDGHTAHTLIVAARIGREIGLFLVEGDAEGVTRTKLDTLDMTRKQALIELHGARAQRLGVAGWDVIEKTVRQALVMLAAECAGGAQRALDMAVDYAKMRVQFGKPIGQFQAIKHKCADMLLDVESARTAAYYAMWTAASDDDELPVAASLAKAYCTEAYFKVTSDNIQVHGGIGFTWEHDAHLFYRRAKSSELLFGDPVYHREQIANILGI